MIIKAVLGAFHIYLVHFGIFSYVRTKNTGVKPPRTVVRTKQVKFGLMKRGSLGPDQPEPWFGSFMV